MGVITKTKTIYPSSVEVLNSNGGSISVTNPNNFIGENGSAASRSYGQWYLVTGANAETFGWLKFDCSEIPKFATITSITGKYKIYSSGNSNQISVKTIQLYCNNRGTAKGNTADISASTSVYNLSCGSDWKRKDLRDIEALIYCKRGTRNTSSNYYARVYGVELTITYTYEEPKGSIYVNVNGNKKKIKEAYVKVNNVYQPVKKIIYNGDEIIF
jgi:hypothetical protein